MIILVFGLPDCLVPRIHIYVHILINYKFNLSDYSFLFKALPFFFFFQAEDGIRDYKVTGVQTCALPISRPRRGLPARRQSDGDVRRARRGAGDHRRGLLRPPDALLVVTSALTAAPRHGW